MIRSLLYVPGDSERFLAKAHQRDADAIIIDLEDAVAPLAKTGAREALGQSVSLAGKSGATVFVRVNSSPDRLFADAAAACSAGAFGLYLPKVTSPALLDEIAAYLAPFEQRKGREPMRFVPLIESPDALFDARAIAKAKRVFALSIGAEDLATGMGARPTPDVLKMPRQLVHIAAKAANVLSFGMMRSVADYHDIPAMAAAAREAREFGFDGATCIHPTIVSCLNEAFAPSSDEVEWAHRVVEASNKAATEGRGAFTLGQQFIDAPIVTRAENILSKSKFV